MTRAATAGLDTAFEVSSCPQRCRRRDSNPRHADYDSSRAVFSGVAGSVRLALLLEIRVSAVESLSLNGVGHVRTLFAPCPARIVSVYSMRWIG
jgi:hypothetical protein